MPKFRFKGDEPHFVPLVGRLVEPDEVFEVAQDYAQAFEDASDRFALVGATDKKKG